MGIITFQNLNVGALLAQKSKRASTQRGTPTEAPINRRLGAFATSSSISPQNWRAYKLQVPRFGRHLTQGDRNHLQYLGAHYLGNNRAVFRVFAPAAKQMQLQLTSSSHHGAYYDPVAPDDTRTLPMKPHPRDPRVFEIEVDQVVPGHLYRFVLEADQSRRYLKDPRSQFQPNDTFGWSQLIDHGAFQWTDSQWKSPFSHRNDSGQSGIPPGMVMAELHLATLGGYDAAKKEIDRLAAEGVCNTVEIMPIGEGYGKLGWGFDEVDKFAPESGLGSPEAFKSLVDYSHKKGLSVVLHVVPNHFGPYGNVVHEFGEALASKDTGWGRRLNFDSHNRDYMRDYMVDMMMNWVVNYHVDGFRMDALQEVDSDQAMKLMTSELRSHPETSKTILIAESMTKSKRLTAPLEAHFINNPEDEVNKAQACSTALLKQGYDAQEIFDFRSVVTALAMDWTIYDCSPSIDDLATVFRQGQRYFEPYGQHLPTPPGSNNVIYVSAHDENDTFGGTRLVPRLIATRLGLTPDRQLTDAHKLNKKPFRDVLPLLKLYLQPNMTEQQWNQQTGALGLSFQVPLSRFAQAYHEAKALNRLTMGTMFVHPGQKRVFMGDQRGELAPFNFNGEYPPDAKHGDKPLADYVSEQKGYRLGHEAYAQSLLDQPELTDPIWQRQMLLYSQDLARLLRTNKALNNGSFTNLKTAVNQQHKLLFVHRWQDNHEVIAVMNYGEKDLQNFSLNSFGIFPQGTWEEVLNSNEAKYGGDGQNVNGAKGITQQQSQVSVPRHSLLIFQKR